MWAILQQRVWQPDHFVLATNQASNGTQAPPCDPNFAPVKSAITAMVVCSMTSNRLVNVMVDIKHFVEMIAILRTTFNLKRTVPEFLLHKNLVISYLTDALPPNDLMPSASTSMAIHHKVGSAKITNIFHKANIEQTFEMADEINPAPFNKTSHVAIPFVLHSL